MGNSLQSVLQDKDFLSAHPDDQMKYLSSIDKDFAGASKSDQGAYLNHVLAPGRLKTAATKTQFEKDNESSLSSAGKVAEKWWTTPKQTSIPGNMPGVEQEPEGMTNSPQQTFQRGAILGAVGAAPEIASGFVAAPVATGLGLAGSVGGGYLGGKAGGYIGEKVGAPELGSDIGGMGGALLGGYAGAKVPKIRSAVGDYIHNPETGKLTPATNKIARGAGLVTGSAAGHATGIPGAGYAGAAAGYELAPVATEKLFPESGGQRLQRSTNQLGAKWGYPETIEESYNRRGAENVAIMKNTERAAKAAGKESPLPGEGNGPGGGVTLVPEPREPLPSDRPGAMWSVKRRTQLPTRTLRGEPGAADVLRQVGTRPLIYEPRGAIGTTSPRFMNAPPVEEPVAPTPRGDYTAPEPAQQVTPTDRRVRPRVTPEENAIWEQSLREAHGGKTPGEELESSMREARNAKPSGVSEGEAQQRIKQDPDQWKEFSKADRKTRDKMLIEAKNKIVEERKTGDNNHGNGRVKGVAFGEGDKNSIKVEGIDAPHSQESDRLKIDPYSKKYQRALRKEPIKRA